MHRGDPTLTLREGVSEGTRTPDRLDHKTTLIYADYAPSAREAEWVEAAFAAPATLTDRRPAALTIVD